MESPQAVNQTKFQARVFIYGGYRAKGKYYYAISVPWEIAKRFVDTPLEVTLELPDGKAIKVTPVLIGTAGGKLGIKLPKEVQEQVKGAKEVTVTLRPVDG